MSVRWTVCGFVLCLPLLCGCGSDERFEVVPVRGTVTCQGMPLTSGMITFTPITEDSTGNPGKSSSAVVGADGTFVLTTYEPEDGAIVGRHKVTWSPPEEGEAEEPNEEDGAEQTRAAVVPLDRSHPCRFGGMTEVEVTDGDNNLKVELSGRTQGGEDSEEEEGE